MPLVSAFVLVVFAEHSLVELVVGIVLMDAGVQANRIYNRVRIFDMNAYLRNRVRSLCMVNYLVGGPFVFTVGSVLRHTAAGWGCVGPEVFLVCPVGCWAVSD